MLLKCWVFLCWALHDVFRNAWCYWGHERKALESCLTVYCITAWRRYFCSPAAVVILNILGLDSFPLGLLLTRSCGWDALISVPPLFSMLLFSINTQCFLSFSRRISEHVLSSRPVVTLATWCPARAVASSQSSHSANRPPRRTSRTGRPNTSTSTRRFTKTPFKTPVSYVIPKASVIIGLHCIICFDHLTKTYY